MARKTRDRRRTSSSPWDDPRIDLAGILIVILLVMLFVAMVPVGKFGITIKNDAALPPSSYVSESKSSRSLGSQEETVSSITPHDYFSSSDEQKEISGFLDSSDGFIIEFVDVPVLERKIILEKLSMSKAEISRALDDYKTELINKQEDFKAKSSGILEKDITDAIRHQFTDTFNGMSLNINSADALKLKTLPTVKEVYSNTKVYTSLMDSIPLIDVNDVWDLGYTGVGVKIAIIDTGIDYTHSDLGGCFGAGCKVEGGYNIIYNNDDPMDDHGHGTHVAATAAGNGILNGVAKDATLYAYKVISVQGTGTADNVMAGIERAVQDNVDIISMSLGGSGTPDDPMSRAVDTVTESGIVVVIAAGNSGPSNFSIGSPGTARGAITVGATYKKDYQAFWWTCTPGTSTQCGTCGADGRVWCDYWHDINPLVNQVTAFSSRGPTTLSTIKPDVVAPGAIICAARYDSLFPTNQSPYYYPCLDGYHVQLAGTSMATPLAAGTVALIKQAHPTWTPAEIKATLKGTSTDLGYEYIVQGGGMINASAAVQIDNPYPIASFKPRSPIVRGVVAIEGTAKDADFASYKAEYKEFGSGSTWTSIGTFYTQVDNGILFSFNSSDIPYNRIEVKLIVYDTEFKKSEDHLFLFNTNNLPQAANWLPGWPQSISPHWYRVGSQYLVFPNNAVVTADLDNNGDIEIIKSDVTLDGSRVHVWNHDGTVFSGWPQDVVISDSTPAVGDIDSDGRLEIAYYGKLFFTNDMVYLWYSNGSLVPDWPKEIQGQSPLSVSSVTFADIDNDGRDELLAYVNPLLYAWNGDGTDVSGWPVFIGGFLSDGKTPSVCGIDGDGQNDIIYFDDDDEIYAFHSNGSLIQGWPVTTPQQAGSSSILGDIDGDRNLEIIQYDGSYSHPLLYVFDGDGNNFSNWPQSTQFRNDYYSGQPILGDITDNQNPEIIVPTKDYFDIFNYTGQRLNRIPVSYEFHIPITADINNDGKSEFIVQGDQNTFHAYNVQGEILTDGWPKQFFDPTYVCHNALSNAIIDVDADGDQDIVFVMDCGSLGSYVNIFDLDSPSTNGKTWSMLMHDERHTGNYNNDDIPVHLEPDTPTTFLSHYDILGAEADFALGSTSPTENNGTDVVRGMVLNGLFIDNSDILTYLIENNLNWPQGTIEFWIKPMWSGTQPGVRTFFDIDNATNGNLFTIGRWYSTATGGFLYAKMLNSTGGSCGEINTINLGTLRREPLVSQRWQANTWHHVAVSWRTEPYELRLYVDGEQVAGRSSSTVCTGGNVPVDFWIGNTYGQSSQMNATLDELRISNVQRTAQDIMNDYSLGLAAQGSYCRYNNGQIVKSPNNCISQGTMSLYCNADAQIVQNCNLCSGCGANQYCDTGSGMCKIRSKPRPTMPA